ncbi:extracellular solute-binding protein [Umezawaea sp. Da 62-37]|uniref:ABC transporter substrate-binding protein n=1 Tax=Umezawaea sp. Da 62-37 TaxID=3075927 RepID=UPI0028F72F66|nr:extracellular solute-binding protein [Umezawaea sp. Da 62-37]WNV85468.1 extracellular solute-binding protein [Umezawaea sp. Da 62-37]
MRNPQWTKLLLLVLVVLLLGTNACGTGNAGVVYVLASWTGAEEDDFRKVLGVFEKATGITVKYNGTRALEQVLASEVQRGTAPDVAVLPNPGSLATYARQDKLHPLGDLLGPQGGYGGQWLALEKAGTGQQYAIAVKVDLKSAIWYDTTNLDGATPATWDELLALSRQLTADGRTPWCLGMGAPPTSGWPGTDWIEDILLHSAGADDYRRWAAGKVPWTSAQVRKAWTDWGALVAVPGAVRGGAPAALLTEFGDAGRGLFTRPARCVLEHQASFVMGGYSAMTRADGSSPAPGKDFAFFPFPGPAVSEVSADLAAMFHNTPQARELMKFLASDQAQRIWPGIRRGSVFSADRNVGDVYDDDVSRQVSSTLTSPDRRLCFDGSDLMPAKMTGAFYQAVLEYLVDPSRLDALLANLDVVRLSVPAGEWLDIPCGQAGVEIGPGTSSQPRPTR